jgi:hypothetical protein
VSSFSGLPSTKEDTESNDNISFLTPKIPKPNFSQKAVPVKQKVENVMPKSSSSSSLNLTNELIEQLSCVQQVVQSKKGTLDEDDDDLVTNIQHDIKQKTIYNTVVTDLVEAIREDIKAIENFNFIMWAVDSSAPSRTYEVCKEYFNFE